MEARIYRDPNRLAEVLEPIRGERGPVVLANGCFDVVHVGHVRYLGEASSLGGILVVAMNDDGSARTLKGEGRPIIPEDERAEILLALECVDFVLIFGEPTVDAVMTVLKPDIHVKGADYTVETVPELETARSIGCRTVIVGDRKRHSSSDIIRKIRGEGKCGS